MTGDFAIRRYAADDLDDCRALWRELVEAHRRIYEDSSIGGANPGMYFDEHLSKIGGDNTWVAVTGSKVVGLLGLILKEGEIEAEPLVVSSEYRGRGIGSALLRTALAEAERLGVKYLCVRPVARNVEAMRFFRTAGFRGIGQVELFVDLSGKEWRSGLNLHDMRFDY